MPAVLTRSPGRLRQDTPGYRWVVLSNTTLGMLIATVNSSIVIISLPAIFRGVGLNPLAPGNVSYLLWMFMGYLLVTAALVVSVGKLGDLYGRTRIYSLGFAVFTVAAIALTLDPAAGGAGALWLIGWRVVQGVGAAMLLANSTAILTDVFPPARRGTAIGINQVAAIAGSFLGLLAGGLLSEVGWRLVFFVSVPLGILGTVWSYASLREVGRGPRPADRRIDWWGNGLLAAGLLAILAAITYGIQPYRGHTMGWTNPAVVAGMLGGVVLLIAFGVVEARAPAPMVSLRLFRIRAFAANNLAGWLASIGRGGLQLVLVIWLQGIWLPLHGYTFEQAPLWAGIYLLPLTAAFLLAAGVSGRMADRRGARALAAVGLLLVAGSFLGLLLLPTDFPYPAFAALVALNGLGSGLFSAPNATSIMNSVPAAERGAASGVRATFFNSGTSLSIGIFFSLMIVGLASTLPQAVTAGLRAHGVDSAAATAAGHLPPVGSLFAAFLGFNPLATMLGSDQLSRLSPADANTLTGNRFFPTLIAGPFHTGLVIAFLVAIALTVVAAAASLAGGRRYVHDDEAASPDGRARPAASAGRLAPRQAPRFRGRAGSGASAVTRPDDDRRAVRLRRRPRRALGRRGVAPGRRPAGPQTTRSCPLRTDPHPALRAGEHRRVRPAAAHGARCPRGDRPADRLQSRRRARRPGPGHPRGRPGRRAQHDPSGQPARRRVPRRLAAVPGRVARLPPGRLRPGGSRAAHRDAAPAACAAG